MSAIMERDTPARPPAPTWKLIIFGVVSACVATAVAAALGRKLAKWRVYRHDLSTFPRELGDDVLLSVGIRPFFDLHLLLIVFAGLVPFVYADHRRVQNRRPIVVWRLILIAVVFTAIPWVGIPSSGGILLFIVLAGPTILVTAFEMFVLTQIANEELAR